MDSLATMHTALCSAVALLFLIAMRYKGKLDQAETNLKHLQRKYDLLDRHVQMETHNWNFTRKSIRELKKELDELRPQKPRVQT